MNNTDLVQAFAALGLVYWQTTLNSPKQIDSRIRDCIENGILVPKYEIAKPRGHTTFSSQREILPPILKTPAIPLAKQKSIGKLDLNEKRATFNFVVNYVDTPPKASEYREQVIVRPKRQRIIIKSTDIQDKKALIAESKARVSIIPEALITSKVFAQSDDEEEEDTEGKVKRSREPPSIYANLKDYEKWDDLVEIFPLSDQAFYRTQSGKHKSKISRAVAPNAAGVAFSTTSEFYQRWFNYFNASLAVWLTRTYNLDQFSASAETLKAKLENEYWLVCEVKPRIRAKMESFHSKDGSTTARWALDYRRIQFREMGKTKCQVRFTCPLRDDIQPMVTLKLSRQACLELDMFHLCLNPEDYLHRRTYQYFYNTCVTNSISDLNTYLTIMSSKPKALALTEHIGKEFKTWWSFIAACGGDYLSADSSKVNRNNAPERPHVDESQYAKVSFH